MNNVNNFKNPNGSTKTKPIWDYWKTYFFYYNIIEELYRTRFQWRFNEEYLNYIEKDGGLIYLEFLLNSQGKAIFFYDDIINQYLIGSVAETSVNHYNQGNAFTANLVNYSRSGLTDENSVLIYNSFTRTGDVLDIGFYADKLASASLTIALNLNSQRMPYILKTTKQGSLSLQNFYGQLESFQPVQYVSKDFELEDIDVLNTQAPFLIDKLMAYKKQVWEECLNMMGIASNIEKKERLVVSEQADNCSTPNATLNIALAPRQSAAKQINDMFFNGEEVCEVFLRKDLQDRVDIMSKMIMSMGMFDDENIDDNEGVEENG